MYGPERLLVNSAGDWGPSKPTAVPDFILAMRLRGHPESLIRRVVLRESAAILPARAGGFEFTPPAVSRRAGSSAARRACTTGFSIRRPVGS